MKIRRKVDPEKWPLPGLNVPNHTHTDFSQLINCPEFIPRQMTEESAGERSRPASWPGLWSLLPPVTLCVRSRVSRSFQSRSAGDQA